MNENKQDAAKIDEERPPCRWCKSADCTPETSPHCYCLDCDSPLDPCRCHPGCIGGNCYQPSCFVEYPPPREETP